ncbi:MAG: hypothetical protein JXB07_07000, partial [Anaerolineae bacterium]|nr:hypothetical protein [Anaerolineae bacterium]
ALKQRGKKTAYRIFRPMMLVFWLALGTMMVIGSASQIERGETLAGIGGAALGVGLMLTGLAQTLDWGWLRIIGVIVLATGPILSGVDFIRAGSHLSGMIGIALGVGILISALGGWPGGIGQMMVGAVILGSGVILLLTTRPLDTATMAIGVVMLALSLWGIIGGAMTLIGGLRRPRQAESAMS